MFSEAFFLVMGEWLYFLMVLIIAIKQKLMNCKLSTSLVYSGHLYIIEEGICDFFCVFY